MIAKEERRLFKLLIVHETNGSWRVVMEQLTLNALFIKYDLYKEKQKNNCIEDCDTGWDSSGRSSKNRHK